DDRFAQKFTPRRDWTTWSALNKQRMRKLIREGRMTQAGLAKIDLAILDEEAPAKPTWSDVQLPPFVERALRASPRAWEFFKSLAPSHRRQYIGWIVNAKREETRARR